MKTGKHRSSLAALGLSVALAFSLCACGGGGTATQTTEPPSPDEDIPADVLMETTKSAEQIKKESELASKAVEMNKEKDNFYGTWIATSDEAINLYGNLEITIKKDGTFDANVTEMDFSGTWKKIDGGISYKSEFMEGKIFYGKTCKMVIEDSGIEVTMKKKKQ